MDKNILRSEMITIEKLTRMESSWKSTTSFRKRNKLAVKAKKRFRGLQHALKVMRKRFDKQELGCYDGSK